MYRCYEITLRAIPDKPAIPRPITRGLTISGYYICFHDNDASRVVETIDNKYLTWQGFYTNHYQKIHSENRLDQNHTVFVSMPRVDV